MPKSGADPRRVLFVLSSSGGGSVINVLLAVRNLDPERYSATVLFYEPSPYAEDFRAAGAQVEVLDTRVRIRSLRKLVPGAISGTRTREGSFRAMRKANRFVQRDLPLARRIARVIRHVGADLVQSSVCPSADRASILGATIARVPQVCYVQYWSDFLPLVDVSLSRHVDRYLCISEAVRTQLRAGLALPDRKVTVAYAPFEFVDLSSTEGCYRTREGLGVRQDEILVANVGRLVSWKGQDVFLRAFGEIASQHPKVRAAIVGGARSTPEGDAYVAELKRLSAELGVEDQVIFTGHRSDVDSLIAASDIVVHSSSQAEPLGRVIMEAIALEKPVIATGAGGVPEMVQDGLTGSLVPPGDAEAMAAALDSILKTPGRAAAMAARARKEAQRRFAAGNFARTLESEYDRILDD